MRHEYDDLFQYALLDGKLVFINEVKNGLECGCLCPQCNEPLVAYNGHNNKRAKHFQHQSLKDCEGAYETIIHHLTKEVIKRQGFLVVPDVDYELSEYAWTYQSNVVESTKKVVGMKRIQFDSVEVEKSAGTYRPDLKCSINGKTLYIEVAVTHFVDETKKAKIYRDGNPVLEIDLSKEGRILTQEQLAGILSKATNKMTWINNTKIQERYFKREATAREIRSFVSSNTRALKVYGKAGDVYQCPMNKGFDKQDKISVGGICNRCRYMVGEWEGVSKLGDDPPRYPSRTIECIGHVASEYCQLLKSRKIPMRDGYWATPKTEKVH